MRTIGIVGVGLLGHAVASRLVQAGHSVIGYDVAPERMSALVALGGKPAASPAALTRESEIVCTILPSLDAVEQSILGGDGVLAASDRRQVICQMSTISPDLTRRLACEVTARGIGFLDCPISGSSAMVAKGDGILMVGGDRTLYEAWKPTLESILPRAIHVGVHGDAMTLKLIANLLVGVHTVAAAEALLMARKAGLDAELALEVLRSSAAGSRMLDVRGPLVVRDTFAPTMKIELFMKDLHLIQEAAAAVGAPIPLTDLAARLYAAANASGHAGDDMAAVVKALGS